MSVLSDDTDVLLLIPPDFFLVPSESDEETANKGVSESLIVSGLITQVNDLEGRICVIESQCLSENSMTGNLHHLRHYGSADSLNCSSKSCLNTRSLQGTPVKGGFSAWKSGGHSPVKRPSFSLEMRDSLLTSNDYVTQKDKDNQLLREVDQFFKKRKNQDEDGMKLCESHQTAVSFSLNKVNDFLKKLDETQKEIEDKMRLKEMTEVEIEDSLTLESVDRELEAKDKSPIDAEATGHLKNVKKVLNFDEDGRRDEGKEKSSLISSTEFHCGEDSFGSVCVKSKLRQADTTERKLEFKKSQELNNLLSLSSLWGSSNNVHKTSEDEQLVKQRLQEEKCRRQHCESLIQQLQLRLLEEQQKVAVALKVDQEKDEAISKLTDGWNKMVGHWREMESQRSSLAKKLLMDREKFKSEISTAYQTVRRYEVELSKALDLAHGYKEKCEASEREKKAQRANATKEIELLKGEVRDKTEKLQMEESKNEKLEKLISAKEEIVNQSKAKLSELQNQMREGRKTMKEIQTELENVKADREKLSEKLRGEQGKVLAAEQSRKALQQQNEELKKREKALREDAKLLTEQMEKVKVELKEFYQEQVESIVQEKLKEFQEQLAAAEKALQAEIEMREKTVTEMAVKQVQQIVEKHLMEVSMLEEKRKEETELWKVKLNQREEKIRELQVKLEHYSSNKTVIAQRLHSVMEAQWQEALKIITSSSPQQAKSPRSEVMARQKTFTMASSGWEDASKSSESSAPFCRDDLVTFREEEKNPEALTYRVDETPQKIDSDHLQKYIKTLLERAPGHPVDDSMESTAYKCLEPLTDESSLTQWQHVLTETSASQVTSSECSKLPKEMKPPWK